MWDFQNGDSHRHVTPWSLVQIHQLLGETCYPKGSTNSFKTPVISEKGWFSECIHWTKKFGKDVKTSTTTWYEQLTSLHRRRKGITDAVPVHIMQSRQISGGVAPFVLNLSTRWSWVVSFMPSHFTLYLPSSQPHIWYPLKRRLSECHSWSEPFAEQRYLLSPLGIEPQFHGYPACVQ